jgi:hypothetical protein
MPFSNYLADATLNWFKNTAFPASTANLYISVHTANPTAVGTTADTTAAIRGVPERSSVAASAFSAPATGGGGRFISNTGVVQITANAVNVPIIRITHFGLWTSDVGGTFLASGELTTGVDVATNDTVQFNPGTLIIRGLTP